FSRDWSSDVCSSDLLLFYGDFFTTKNYSNGHKYDFSDWKRNIRKSDFKQLLQILTKKSLQDHLDDLQRDFLKGKSDEINKSQIALPAGYTIREKLIFYSLLLNPDEL